LALSRYLRFLLSPDETHGQSSLFLKGFLSLIEKSGHDSPITTGGSHHKVIAWTPFLFLTATVTLWSIPPFKALFASG
ncbi:L-lactate permease, partial [Escherichia coli]|nr:L-lactate permease [Escherichia coli]